MESIGSKKTISGFTLIELLSVVAIIALLMAIAYPSYLEQVRKANRSDAKAALTDAKARLERCLTVNSNYNTNCAAATELSSSYASDEEFYTISANITAAAYTLSATAVKAPQTEDADCLTMTLSNLGQKTPDNDICW